MMSARCGSNNDSFTQDISLINGESSSLDDAHLSKWEMKADEQGVIGKVYHASLRLIHSLAVILVSFKMTVIPSGPVSKIKTVIHCDNNGLKTVAPRHDHCVCCKCPDGCSIHSLCKRGCPKIERPLCAGLPIVPETDDDNKLEKRKGQLMHQVEKRRFEMSATTRKMSSGYKHLLDHEIIPFIRRALETKQLSLTRLKMWMINTRRNLKPIIYEEKQAEKVLQSLQEIFPRWYDTDLLQNLVDWLEKHLKVDLKEKRSLQTFISTVDEFFSKRVFIEGVGENQQPNALMCIDPEWSQYPATEFHLVYGRAVKALRHIRGCGFTIFFCTVLKECIIRAKIGAALSTFEKAINEESTYGGGEFPTAEKEEFIHGTSMLVTGKGLVLAVDDSCVDVSAIGGCDMFDEKQPLLVDCIKRFKSDYGP